jgi:hypothetical protein
MTGIERLISTDASTNITDRNDDVVLSGHTLDNGTERGIIGHVCAYGVWTWVWRGITFKNNAELYRFIKNCTITSKERTFE